MVAFQSTKKAGTSMKLFTTTALLGILAGGSAMATEYSVGIANVGSGVFGGGTAIELYATTDSSIKLVQTYVLHQKDFTGNLASPLILALNPARDFVYVAYTGLSQPNVVGFKITPTGLDLQWEKEFATGDSSLQGATLAAGPGYVIENTYPAPGVGIWVHVLDEAGAEVLSDYDDDGGGVWLISGQVDATKTFYYSCRNTASSPPATLVSVYAFKAGEDVHTWSTKPVASTHNPVYVQSVCN
jgi:hypothetical protein